jgi:hypothetical protein
MRSIDFGKLGSLLPTFVFVTIGGFSLLADDRPSFQGPTEMAIISKENLPLEWVTPEAEAILWASPNQPCKSLLHLFGLLNKTFQHSTQKPNS